MSIIFKALQKTQDNIAMQINPINAERFARGLRWLDIILIVLISVLMLLATVAYYPKVKSYFLADKNHVPVVIPEVEYQGDLILNGVFVSNNENIALINNQQYHIGELIKGMRVLSIDQSRVRLAAADRIYVIHVFSY